MTDSSSETIVDSPVGWVAAHITAYLESGGEKSKAGGREMLLLTTRGRKSGRLYRTALYYSRDGDRYLVVPSNGGSSRHPEWYLNLLAQPSVKIQVGPDLFDAMARPATAEEKPRLWEASVAFFPPYEGMQKKTKREIPVVVIEPTSGARTD